MFDWRTIHLDIDEQHSLGNILETISLDRLRSSLHMIGLYISIDEVLLDVIRPFIREVSTAETPRTGMNSIEDEFTRELFEKLSSYDPRIACSIYSYIPYDFSMHGGTFYDMRKYLLMTRSIIEHVPDVLTSWPLAEDKKSLVLDLIQHFAREGQLIKRIIKFLNTEPYSSWEEDMCYFFGKHFAPLNWFTVKCNFVQTLSAWRSIIIWLDRDDFETWRGWLNSIEIFEESDIPDLSFSDISTLLERVKILASSVRLNKHGYSTRRAYRSRRQVLSIIFAL